MKFINEVKTYIKDPKDVSYLAACIHMKAAGIWTHDSDFQEQKRCKIFTNIDMLNLVESA